MNRLVVPLLVLLAIAAPSIAGIVTVGGIFAGDSWGQGWQETGVGPFDLIAAQSVAGSSFEIPGLRNPSDGSWNAGTNGSISYISGPSLSDIQFDTIFNDPEVVPTTFDFVAFNGLAIVDAARITNDATSGGASIGYGWYLLSSSPWQPERSDIPEPATMALLGLGVLALRRRK